MQIYIWSAAATKARSNGAKATCQSQTDSTHLISKVAPPTRNEIWSVRTENRPEEYSFECSLAIKDFPCGRTDKLIIKNRKMTFLTQESGNGGRIRYIPVPSHFESDVKNVMILSHSADLRNDDLRAATKQVVGARQLKRAKQTLRGQ